MSNAGDVLRLINPIISSLSFWGDGEREGKNNKTALTKWITKSICHNRLVDLSGASRLFVIMAATV